MLIKKLSIYLYLYLYLYIYIYIYLYLYLSHSLSPLSLSLSHLSPSLSLVLIKKKKGPQSLLQIGGDRGAIEMVNLAVCKDIAKILGASVGHAHLFDAYWNLLFVFKPP